MNWISVEDRIPKGPGEVLKVKLGNGEELKAYFHRDQMIGMSFFWGRDHKLSHWQCHKTKKWLYDVTHWMSLEEPLRYQEGK